MSTVNEEVVIPNESRFIREALHLYKHFEHSLIPITLTSVIFSDALLSDIRDKQIIRRILQFESVPNSILNQVFLCASDALGVSAEDAMRLFTVDGGQVSLTPVCVNPTVRRLSLVGADIVPFDITLDNPCFVNVLCPLSPCVVERLRIGMSLVINAQGFKPKKGLRFFKHTNDVWAPDFKPRVLDDAIEVTYSRDLIRAHQIQAGVRYCWTFNGNAYTRDFPNVHLIIDDLQEVTASHVAMIVEGIRSGWLMVDLPEQYFIPEIVISRVAQLSEMERILKYGFGRLVDIKFTDGTGSPTLPMGMPYGDESFDQYIFPLHGVTQDYLIGSLSDFDSDLPPAATKLPSKYNLDTGRLNAYRMPVFSDGTPKIGHSKICMSNIVSVFTKSLIYTDEIKNKNLRTSSFICVKYISKRLIVYLPRYNSS